MARGAPVASLLWDELPALAFQEHSTYAPWLVSAEGSPCLPSVMFTGRLHWGEAAAFGHLPLAFLSGSSSCEAHSCFLSCVCHRGAGRTLSVSIWDRKGVSRHLTRDVPHLEPLVLGIAPLSGVLDTVPSPSSALSAIHGNCLLHR